MPVIVDEHTQYTNVGGKPLVNGKVFIGVVNQDPVLNPEPIFADPPLTIPLANPQALNSRGQTVNKMYVAGRYSFKLEDSNGGQIDQDLDRGTAPAIGITALTFVQGTNAITAQANPTISFYTDKAQFSLTIINSPTGATTLNIDGLGAVPIKNNGIDIQPEQIAANSIVVVAFNAIGPVFELISNQIAGLGGIQTFTSSGTWNKPIGVKSILIACTGGGGGAATGSGGAGATVIKFVSSPAASYTITIGQGGAASSNGGTSSVGAVASANGGTGGSSLNAGAGATVGAGDLVIAGGDGFAITEGQGGGSFWGGGGGGTQIQDAECFGAGGGGTNGTGKSGVILILEFA